MKLGKTTKKLLAAVMSIVLILSSATVAFAEQTTQQPQQTYSVSYSSPAIPMNEMTTVDLKNISVQLTKEETSFVSGDNLTWAVADETAAVSLNNEAKTLTAVATGNYKLTVTDGTVTKNVWVVVKKASEDDFYLVKYDFATDEYNPDEWNYIYFNMGSSNKKFSSDPSESPAHIKYTKGTGIVLGPNNNANGGGWVNHGVLLNNNEIFKDFADYTVTTVASANKSNGYSGFGTVGRAVLEADGTLSTTKPTLLSIQRGNGGVQLTSPVASGWWFSGYNTCENSDISKVSGEFWCQNNTRHTVQTVYSGEKLTFSIDGIVDLKTENFTSEQTANYKKAANYTVSAGYPGIMTHDLPSTFYSFSVKLNSNAVPTSTPFTAYKVEYSAPALPMNEMTTVDLNGVIIQMTEDENSYALASELICSVDADADVILDNNLNTVTAIAEGNYKLTFSDGSNTKNVWVVVKKESDTEFILVDLDFSIDDFDSTSWKRFGASNFEVLDSSTMSVSNGKLGVSGHSFIVYYDEIFKDFADYTVTAEVSANKGIYGDWAGFGACGRIALEADGTLSTTKPSVLNYQRGMGGVRILSPVTKNWWVATYNTCTSAEIVRSTDSNGDYNYWCSKDIKHTVTTVFDGENLEFSIDGIVDYKTENATDSEKQAWKNANNFTDDAGYAGILSWDTGTSLYTFTVKLNNQSMPATANFESYKVDYLAPAIPMNVMTQVEIDGLFIQTQKDGNYIWGGKLNWSLGENVSGLDIMDGVISAYAVGNYPVTITDSNGVSTKVYVCVKNSTDSEIVLYSEDFTKNKTIDYTVWTQYEKRFSTWTGPFTTIPDQSKAYTANKYTLRGVSPFIHGLEIGGRQDENGNDTSWNNGYQFNFKSYLWLKDEMISDFGIYTITAEYAGYGLLSDGNQDNFCYSPMGIMARMGIEEDGKYLGVDSVRVGQEIQDSAKLYDGSKTVDTVSHSKWGLSTQQTMTLKLTADKAVSTIYYDASHILTLESTDIKTADRGPVGFYSNGYEVDLLNFKVAYPVTSMPKATALEIFAISNTAPVLPMVVNTVVDLKNITVDITGNGNSVFANTVDWSTNESSDNIVVNNTKKTISVYKTGVYKLVATSGNNSRNIYVSCAETENGPFNIFSYDFTNFETDSKNGTLPFIYKKAEAGAIFNEETTYSHNFNSGIEHLGQSSGSLIVSDPIMKDFSDYTVSFTAAATLGNNVWRLLGIHSRIVLGDNNSLVNYGVSSMLSYAPAEKSETKILVRTNNNNGLQPMGDWMPDRSKIYDSCLELNKYYNFNYKLYGQSITASCVDADTNTELFSVNAEDYFKDEYTASVIPTNKGTVAITRNDLACYIKTLSVSVEIEKLPKYRSTNAATAELTVNMDKNSYIKLDSLNFILDGKTVNGASMRWTTERQPLYEINNSAKEFAAYGNGSFKLSAVYDRKTYEVTFNVTEENVEKVHSFSLVSVTGSGSLAIKPVDGGTNDYTVTVTAGDGTEFKQLSLYNKTLRIINTTDETGRVFGFTADKPSDIKLTAEFLAKDTDMNTYALGATVNQVKQGVRFGYRTSAIKWANTGSEFGTLSKKIQTDNGTLDVTSMGVLMLPTALLNGELTVDTAKVKNSEVKTVISLTDSFADFAFTIVNIPTSQLGTELTVRPYMKYEKEDGSVEYVYGETQQRSFNDINSSILANLDVSLLKLTGGTTNDYDDNAATTSVSYNSGDTITFNVWTKYSGVDFTGVKLKWEIYQDGDAEVYETTEGKKAIRLNPVATGEEISSATKPLTVSITPNKLEAGTVYLHVKAYTSDGKAYSGVQDFTGGAVYNKDAITPSVSEPAGFETFWQTMADDVEDFFTSKSEDLKVTVSELNAGYVKEYSNGDKISIKPASDKISGYSSSAYCYEVRIEYGSSSGRAASTFVSIPKTVGNITKGIGFMGYNTGNPSGLWCVGNWLYANSEAHGIAFDDPDNTRATYTEKYNEPNFLFNYDNLSETELANIVLTDTEYYRMYERNTYILRFMHYLSVEGYTDNGKVALHGGSMGGMQALSLAGIDALFTNNCVSAVDINLAAWCLDLSGKTALGTLTSWAPMGNSVVNYFDTVHFANFINKKNTRINLVAGLGDLTSPTYSQLAFYNTLEKNASIKFSQNASHGASDSQGVQCSYSK